VIYFLSGAIASALMLLYRRPVHELSPLRQLSIESPSLAARLAGGGGRIASQFGLVCSFTVLFLVAALRYGIGTDYWPRYAPLFTLIEQGDQVQSDSGYVLINRIVAGLTDDYQWIFVATSFLTLILFYRFIVRMSLNPALSVFLFVFGGFYLETFNLVQQGLAIAILLNTLELVMRRKHLLFVILTLVAASVHSSALIWFAIWPLIWTRFNRVTRFVLALAMVFVITAAPLVLTQVIRQVASEYAWYFESNYGVVLAFDPGGLGIAVLVFLASVLFVKRNKSEDRYVDAVVNLQGVHVAVLVATLSVAYAFSRLAYYFAPIQMLAVPLLLSTIRDDAIRRLVTCLVMVVYAVVFYFKFIVWNAHGVMPYEWVFSR
jgi:hypothetical protein